MPSKVRVTATVSVSGRVANIFLIFLLFVCSVVFASPLAAANREKEFMGTPQTPAGASPLHPKSGQRNYWGPPHCLSDSVPCTPFMFPGHREAPGRRLAMPADG